MSKKAQTQANDNQTPAALATEKKRNALYEASKVRNEVGTAIGAAWGFRPDTKAEGIIVMLKDLTPEMVAEAACHGLIQKGSDAAAKPRDTESGKSATDADKIAAIRDTIDRVCGGVWNAAREGGGNGGGELLQAVIVAYPDKTPERLKEWLEAKSKVERDALAEKNERVKSALSAIRAKRTAAVEIETLDEELENL